MKPTTTTRQALRTLMKNEFHPDGVDSFDPTEPDRYIERLTSEQLDLLSNSALVLNNSMTAFLTFGDGFIDRPMGADFGGFVHLLGKDSIRPNASLGIFYKPASGSSIELVFYTRFFVVSYYRFRKSKKKCKELDGTAMGAAQRSTIKKDIFREMCDLVKNRWWNLPNKQWKAEDLKLGKWPPSHRYGLVVGPVVHPIYKKSASCFPYLYLKAEDSPGRFNHHAPFMGGGEGHNKIHGTYNTRGCWMLGRNYTWGWPNENKIAANGFQTYKLIMDYWLPWRRKGQDYMQRATNDSLDTSNAYNHSYLHLINLLGGLKLNRQDSYVASPPLGAITDSPQHNAWKYCSNSWANNLLGISLAKAKTSADTEPCNGHMQKLLSYLFLFKRPVGFGQFTPDFLYEPGAPNDKFDKGI